MSSEGFYSVVFEGIAGWGAGMLVLDTQLVVGADPWGGKYDGNYVVNLDTNTIDLKVKVTMSANTMSVTGHSGGSTFELNGSIPRGALTNHKHTVSTPDGRTVDVVLSKIRDFP